MVARHLVARGVRKSSICITNESDISDTYPSLHASCFYVHFNALILNNFIAPALDLPMVRKIYYAIHDWTILPGTLGGVLKVSVFFCIGLSRFFIKISIFLGMKTTRYTNYFFRPSLVCFSIVLWKMPKYRRRRINRSMLIAALLIETYISIVCAP